eukprot:768715-Hanusia_phi.AAC.11
MSFDMSAEDFLNESNSATMPEYAHNRSISIDWKEQYESIKHDMAGSSDSRAGNNLKALERIYSNSKNGPRKRQAVRPWISSSNANARDSRTENDEESAFGGDVDEYEMRIRMATIKGSLSKLEEEMSKLEARKRERHDAALRLVQMLAHKKQMAMESIAKAEQRAREVKALLNAKQQTGDYLRAGIEKLRLVNVKNHQDLTDIWETVSNHQLNSENEDLQVSQQAADGEECAAAANRKGSGAAHMDAPCAVSDLGDFAERHMGQGPEKDRREIELFGKNEDLLSCMNLECGRRSRGRRGDQVDTVPNTVQSSGMPLRPASTRHRAVLTRRGPGQLGNGGRGARCETVWYSESRESPEPGSGVSESDSRCGRPGMSHVCRRPPAPPPALAGVSGPLIGQPVRPAPGPGRRQLR